MNAVRKRKLNHHQNVKPTPRNLKVQHLEVNPHLLQHLEVHPHQLLLHHLEVNPYLLQHLEVNPHLLQVQHQVHPRHVQQLHQVQRRKWIMVNE